MQSYAILPITDSWKPRFQLERNHLGCMYYVELLVSFCNSGDGTFFGDVGSSGCNITVLHTDSDGQRYK